LQLLAGMWTFVRHNTFAAVALGFYGAFWISYWALNTFYLSRIPAAEQNSALGLFLIFWTVRLPGSSWNFAGDPTGDGLMVRR
jgi:uncharacterized protein